MRSRGALSPLFFLFLLSPWPSIPYLRSSRDSQTVPQSIFLASAALVNFTIDDTSSLILYSPSGKWRASTQACATCLAPDPRLAYAGTWHDGTHIIPTVDADDTGGNVDGDAEDDVDEDGKGGKGKGKDSDDKGGDNDDKKEGDDDSKGQGGHGKGRRDVEASRGVRTFRRQTADANNPFFTNKEDSDDAGFVDTPLLAEFNFTGSAIYIYALIPLFAAASNTTPTFVNLTYTLDSQPAGTYLHTGSPSNSAPLSNTTSYLSQLLVFQKSGLTESEHTLTANVGPDSVLLLDYIIYTQDSEVDVITGSSSQGSLPMITSIPTQSVSAGAASMSQTTSETTSSSKSHNVATFAGAVGGSVGLLSLLALSLAFSIYRRRRLSARRDRAYRESRRETNSVSSFHTDGSEDGPPMQGPAPFVPRYFPGTVITAAPPPYSPPASPSNSPTSALLGPPETPIPSMPWTSRRLGIAGESDSASYAERPPPTPPPPGTGGNADMEDGYFAPPPPFPVAIATPVPAILAGLSGTASTSTSPSPAPQSSAPPSPVIPLLLPPPPPPPAQPVTLMSSLQQTPIAGPSSNQSTSTVSQPLVSSRSSTRSISMIDEESSTSFSPDGSSIRHPSTPSRPPSITTPSTSSPPTPHPESESIAQESSRTENRNSIGQ